MLNYTISGAGTAVLFLHGFLESSTMWRRLALEDFEFRCVCVDLPGHGNSDLGFFSPPPSLDNFAQKIIDLVDHLELDHYHVVGHSMGGYVALLLKEMDQRCKKVVLLNSNFWTDHDQKKRDRIRMADLAFNAREHLIREAIPGLFWNLTAKDTAVQELLHEALMIDPESIAFASLAMMNREDKRHLLEEFPNDFLMIHGKHDPIIQQDILEEQLKSLNIRVEYLDWSGHMAHVEESHLVQSVLREFLF